ncbi:MAG: outer membrane beta-barrel protein [Cytophagaceae bacterium]|nr:outer membrane beta-barrel protein [Cytophagaceae bacterium]
MTFYKHLLYSLLFSYFVFVHHSHAQSKWSLGPAAGASYNILQKDKFDNFDPGLGYQAGLSTMHFFTPHWFVSAGLSYTKKSFTLTGIPDTRYIFSGGGIQYYSMKYSYSYLSLPLEVGYSFFDLADHKLSIIASGGIVLNVLLYEKLKSKDLEPAFSDNATNNSFSATAIASIGLLYNISPRLFLMVSPRYSYDFYASKTNNSPDDLRFQSLSLNTSLQYRLGK